MGKNASGQTHYLSLSGLELYGTVTAVCEDQLGKAVARSVSDVRRTDVGPRLIETPPLSVSPLR